jgi:hypothetical protein
MPRLSALTLVWALLSLTAEAQSPDLTRAMPEALRAHIGGETFTPLTTVAALPQGLKGELARLFKEKSLQLADPGAPYNATDAVGPDPLPFRRLIAAGCAADHCLVHYERGGIAHTYAVLVLSRKGETIRLVWGGAPYGPLAGVKAVRDALAAGNVVGQTEYW